MTKNYLKNYQTLGIRPGARWEELRNAYKNLVKSWHPDRFQQDADQKKIAEERTKEINKSYKELSEYYKKHGSLPIHEKPENAHEHEQEIAHPGTKIPTQQYEADAKGHTTTAQNRASASAKPARSARTTVIVILVGAGLAVWFLMFGHRLEKPSSRELAEVSRLPETNERNTAPTARESGFTFGSSIGEVIAIQGVPTKTAGNVWSYGDSKIYFEKGKVVRWEESANYPLKTQIVGESAPTKSNSFTIGSTKADVLTIQGAPDRDAGNVWDYGASRVYFRGDRVTRWDESPFNPLRTRR